VKGQQNKFSSRNKATVLLITKDIPGSVWGTKLPFAANGAASVGLWFTLRLGKNDRRKLAVEGYQVVGFGLPRGYEEA